MVASTAAVERSGPVDTASVNYYAFLYLPGLDNRNKRSDNRSS